MNTQPTNNPIERLKELDSLKKALEHSLDMIKRTEMEADFGNFKHVIRDPVAPVVYEIDTSYPEVIEREKKFAERLREKILNFDVYQQKRVYRCGGCYKFEQDCICNSTGLTW